MADDYREQANAVRDAWVQSRWDDLKAMNVLTARDLHTLEAEEANLIDLRPYSRNPSSRHEHTEVLVRRLEAAARAFRPKAHDIHVEVMPDMLEVSFMPSNVPAGGTRGILTPTAKKWGNTVAKLLREHPEATLPALPGKVGQSHDGRIYARVFLA